MTDPIHAAGDSAPPPPRRGWRTRTKLTLAAVVLAPVILFALYTLLVLNWSYSEGYRAGILQKFSNRGYLCKTWEGELAMTTVPGVAPTLWTFSVRDDGTAKLLSDATGRRVKVHYTEHRGVPTECFGTTSYYVDSVQVIQ